MLRITLKAENPSNARVFDGMGRPGFEPETNRLKAECSTAELATRIDAFTLANITQSISEVQIKLQLFWAIAKQPF